MERLLWLAKMWSGAELDVETSKMVALLEVFRWLDGCAAEVGEEGGRWTDREWHGGGIRLCETMYYIILPRFGRIIEI